MARYALVKNSQVINVVVYNEEPIAEQLGVDSVIDIATTNPRIGIGYKLVDGSWEAPLSDFEAQAELFAPTE